MLQDDIRLQVVVVVLSSARNVQHDVLLLFFFVSNETIVSVCLSNKKLKLQHRIVSSSAKAVHEVSISYLLSNEYVATHCF